MFINWNITWINHNSTLAIIKHHDATVNKHHIMHKTCSKLMGECMKDKDLYCHWKGLTIFYVHSLVQVPCQGKASQENAIANDIKK
jgi:hypothetical protein